MISSREELAVNSYSSVSSTCRSMMVPASNGVRGALAGPKYWKTIPDQNKDNWRTSRFSALRANHLPIARRRDACPERERRIALRYRGGIWVTLRGSVNPLNGMVMVSLPESGSVALPDSGRLTITIPFKGFTLPR